MLAVIGSAPEDGTSAAVAERFCSAARDALEAIGNSASATLSLLQLIMDAACLPQASCSLTAALSGWTFFFCILALKILKPPLLLTHLARADRGIGSEERSC